MRDVRILVKRLKRFDQGAVIISSLTVELYKKKNINDIFKIGYYIYRGSSNMSI